MHICRCNIFTYMYEYMSLSPTLLLHSGARPTKSSGVVTRFWQMAGRVGVAWTGCHGMARRGLSTGRSCQAWDVQARPIPSLTWLGATGSSQAFADMTWARTILVSPRCFF